MGASNTCIAKRHAALSYHKGRFSYLGRDRKSLTNLIIQSLQATKHSLFFVFVNFSDLWHMTHNKTNEKNGRFSNFLFFVLNIKHLFVPNYLGIKWLKN